MGNLSFRYSYTIQKKYDGNTQGSSSLWAMRMGKAYGVLSKKLEHQIEYDKNTKFDYSKKQIDTARRLRTGYYKRILYPKNIANALYYCPVVLDMEIFDSIFSDQEGTITMPDESDKKEEFSHCFSVVGYNKKDNSFFINSSNWPDWGKKGLGSVSLEYLDKYFITAFAMDGFPRLMPETRKELSRKKAKISSKKYYFHTFLENNFQCDHRSQLDVEVINSGGDLIGWVHFAINKDKIVELLDIFILEEYRRQGIGSVLIKMIVNSSRCKGVAGYIAAQDLIGEREEFVKNFLLKNDLMVFVDRSQFKDARFRIESIK